MTNEEFLKSKQELYDLLVSRALTYPILHGSAVVGHYTIGFGDFKGVTISTEPSFHTFMTKMNNSQQFKDIHVKLNHEFSAFVIEQALRFQKLEDERVDREGVEFEMNSRLEAARRMQEFINAF